MRSPTATAARRSAEPPPRLRWSRRRCRRSLDGRAIRSTLPHSAANRRPARRSRTGSIPTTRSHSRPASLTLGVTIRPRELGSPANSELKSEGRARGKIGRAHDCTPVTNALLVCRLLLEKIRHHIYKCLPLCISSQLISLHKQVLIYII